MMKNETAQLQVTYQLSFPEQGKKPMPPGSAAIAQKMDGILADLTFILQGGRTQSTFFSDHDFDESDRIEQMSKEVYQAGHVYYLDATSRTQLIRLSFLGEEYLLRNDGKLTWDIHPDQEKVINGISCCYATGKINTPGWEKPTLVSAWFAEEYAVPFGPAELYGLPGLIVQGQVGAKAYTAITIDPLPTGAQAIEMPEVAPADLSTLSGFMNRMKQMVPPPGA